jgi:hypothetical protein
VTLVRAGLLKHAELQKGTNINHPRVSGVSGCSHNVLTAFRLPLPRVTGSPCAYKAHYSDSKMVPAKEGESAEPRACAGVKGTVITVEDLFYNVPSRRQALKNPTEEYAKIVEVVSRYALRFPKVSFTCKKMGDNTADVKTRPNSTVKCAQTTRACMLLLPVHCHASVC